MFYLSLPSLLDHNLQVLLTTVLSVITTEYIQLIFIKMMNKLFQKQAALSPKNHNRHLAPILISISTRNYFHF